VDTFLMVLAGKYTAKYIHKLNQKYQKTQLVMLHIKKINKIILQEQFLNFWRV